MNVLIACEESQRVCKAFRKKGHNAFSCDILPCSGGHPEWHIKCDAQKIAAPSYCDFAGVKIKYGIDFFTQNNEKYFINKWDLVIAHPPCTRLTVAANKYYKPQYAERFPNILKEREDAIYFFMWFTKLPCEKICIENPIGIMSTYYKKPTQIIQPYQFGDPERKATCLWLKGLPPLKPTNIIEPNIVYHKSGRTDSKLHFDTLKLPKEERSKMRSRTFYGIANAMAEQWG